MNTPNDGGEFRLPPQQVVDGIPIFSPASEYSDNYDAISADHLAEYEKSGQNPFMPQDLINDLESETAELITKYTPEDGKILDVGVGLGNLLSRTRIKYKYGVDISLAYLKKTQKRGISCAMAMIEDLPYKKETFDTVVTTDVIEHVIDLNFCCANIISTLKTDGHLIVRVPFEEPLSAYLADGVPYHFIHLRYFNLEGLRLLFEKCFNMEFIEAKTSGILPMENRLKNPALTPSAEFFSFAEKLREQDHPNYKVILDSYYKKLEINAIFKKTATSNAAIGFYLHQRLNADNIDYRHELSSANAILLKKISESERKMKESEERLERAIQRDIFHASAMQLWKELRKRVLKRYFTPK